MNAELEWLVNGDASIEYMTRKNLLGCNDKEVSKIQQRIEEEGFGAHFLSLRNKDGHWGKYYYQPKWTSTHYTLMDLRNLCIKPRIPACREMVTRMFDECMDDRGA